VAFRLGRWGGTDMQATSADDALHDEMDLIEATRWIYTPIPEPGHNIGAPLSHASIVARELGIPAVIGAGNATMRLHDGDHIRVDGERGTVERRGAG